ncbi:3'-5' exonuclease [Saezia sanguinis]|uniref:3'-5' exonuclease n=1 Tax=Saezia sanguinis TaxID=1965230 RepID=UPI003036D092
MILFSQTTQENNIQPGEKRFITALKKLNDRYLCWYDIPAGDEQFRSDFIILHPERGLLVIEVKDWRMDTIWSIGMDYACIRKRNGEISREKNPLTQAQNNAFKLVRLLEDDPLLTNPKGHQYEGKLICPYAYGVVFSNITRKQFFDKGFDKVFPENLTICKDEMSANMDAEVLQTRLWSMFRVPFQHALSASQITQIRGTIFPDICLGTQQNLFDEVDDFSILNVMDEQQEQLARGMGDGHRIVHGAAGSGKTKILEYRAKFLASFPNKTVLVLCFGRPLRNRLHKNFADMGLEEKITVMTFHQWCLHQLEQFYCVVPEGDEDSGQFAQACFKNAVENLEKTLIPCGQYETILIDEGHDFKKDWFKLIVQMLHPLNNNLLVLYDDAQAIYDKDKEQFSFSSVGINARGRTNILRRNYRNTVEILTFAKAFAADLIANKTCDEDHVPIIEPICAGRNGLLPQVIEKNSLYDEMSCIIDLLIKKHEAGVPWDEMAVIYRRKYIGNQVKEYLKKCHIPTTHSSTEDDAVHLFTIHGSKGLEFPIVCLPAAGEPFSNMQSQEDEAQLLYVAMTRATRQLVLTHGENSCFAEAFQRALDVF